MVSKELNELVKRSESLEPDEQLLLIAHLTEMLRKAYKKPITRRKWREICGLAPYPLLGEDAQAWVSRTRREGDEHRDQ